MTDTAASFIAKSTVKAEDLDHRKKINFNIGAICEAPRLQLMLNRLRFHARFGSYIATNVLTG